jgi:hypothetical protein
MEREELRKTPTNGTLAVLQTVALAVLMIAAISIFLAAAITTIVR